MSLINKIDITKFSDEELKAIGDETKLRLALHAKNENLRQHLWSLVHAVGRLMDDKYSEGDEKVRNQLWQDMHRTGDNAREYLQSDELKDSPYQGSAELTDQDYDQLISQNVEKMWGSLEMASLDYFKETGKITGSFRFRLLSLMQFHQWRVEKAAHVACAEKYTAIIEQKDKEIERLQRFVFNVRDWAMPMDYRGIAKMQEIAGDVLKANIALKTQTP